MLKSKGTKISETEIRLTTGPGGDFTKLRWGIKMGYLGYPKLNLALVSQKNEHISYRGDLLFVVGLLLTRLRARLILF